jgi:hypothetical protein
MNLTGGTFSPTQGRVALGIVLLGLGAMLQAEQDLFSDVRLLQRAAAPVVPSVAWRNIGAAGFLGSETVEIRGRGLVPSNIQYDIMGKTGSRVDEVSISAFVASLNDLSVCKTRLDAAAIQWFRAVGVSYPNALHGAIRADTKFHQNIRGPQSTTQPRSALVQA